MVLKSPHEITMPWTQPDEITERDRRPKYRPWTLPRRQWTVISTL